MGKKAWTIVTIKEYLINNSINLELISAEYKNIDKKLIWKCKECESVFEKSWHHLKAKNKDYCNNCYKIKDINNNRTNIEKVRVKIKEIGLTPLFDTYKNNNENLLVKDNEGYKFYITLGNLKKENKYIGNKFNKNNNFAVYNINLYLENNNIKLKLLSTEYNGKEDKLLWKCNCSKEFKTTFGNVVQQNKTRCDTCSKRKYRYEYEVEEFLKSNNIKYKNQYKFENCRDKYALPFDFAIFDKNNNIYLCEVDGEQHFEAVNFNGVGDRKAIESYNSTKFHDKIKDNYCIDNNIKLIRIPYWEIDNKEFVNKINTLL